MISEVPDMQAPDGRSQPAPAAALVLDPTMGDRSGRWLRDELNRENWQAARDLLHHVEDPDDRYFYTVLCADRQGRPEWLDAWVAAEPTAGTPLLVRGAHAVYWAWEARGGAGADQTSEAAFRTFHERLELAEADLRAAAARSPSDPTPWTFLVTTCRGLEHGLEELATRFEEVLARHPGHRAAHSQMLQGVAAKWGGSELLMFNFAREAASTSQAGSGLASILAEAHIEQWLSLDGDEQVRYFERQDVLTELHQAADWSVRHPSWQPHPGWPRDHNLFAFCFALGDDFPAAAYHFQAVGDLVTASPWQYLAAGATEPFESHRRRVFESLRR